MPRPRLYFAIGCAFVAACSSDSGTGGTGTTSYSLALAAGNNQTGGTGTALASALSVTVTNGTQPVAGATVTFTLTSGVGSISPTTVTTGASGVAASLLTLGNTAGSITVIATVAGGSDTTTFHETAIVTTATIPQLVSLVPMPSGATYHHDTYVRDGLAFVCAWNKGVLIYDVGDGRLGGDPTNPKLISQLITSDDGVAGGASVHNAWWFHNPVTGEKRYLFIGQEGPGSVGTASSGDIHVVDVSNLAAPVEVAQFKVPNAGTHNFWMDESRQVLYAAYYNGGVVEVDVSGTLTGDISSRIMHRVTPGGAGNTYVWGVMLANNTLYATDMLSGFWALDPVTLATKGGGNNNVPNRYGSDQWVSGNKAYSGTWGRRGVVAGNVINIWSLDGAGVPTLSDSIVVPNVSTISDIAVTPNGRALVFTTEGGTGNGLYVFSLVSSTPTLLGSVLVAAGLHTGEVSVINGRTYVFTAEDPGTPRMRVYDITGMIP